MISVITPTHDATWLSETWASLRRQDNPFEWVVVVNGPDTDALSRRVKHIVEGDPRVMIHKDTLPGLGVGARKRKAFDLGTPSGILLELDHDDLLAPGALSEVEKAFEDPEIGFVYSDFADFGLPITYQHPDIRPGWVANGHEFYKAGIDDIEYECVRAFAPSALTFSLIYQAPNHLRAWRRSAYDAAGGHDPNLRVCDDHDLLLRTYLATKCAHIPKPLYLYRVTGQNTWAQNQKEIARLTFTGREAYLERLVLRECALRGLPAYDLGGAINPRERWKVVDSMDAVANLQSSAWPAVSHEGTPIDVVADLRERWPFEDNSVGAFRASDFLEHLPDPQHTMREIYRCLVPGGWLLSMTPSTDGRGAWCDPTHVSFWNELSFHYWTRREKAKYIRNTDVRFMEIQLDTVHGELPYVRANLVAIKDGVRLAGEKFI